MRLRPDLQDHHNLLDSADKLCHINSKTVFYIMKQQSVKLNSIEKSLQILLAFTAERPSWGVRELSAYLGFSPATTQRILQILKNEAFVEQDHHSRQYRLGHIYYRFLHILQNSHPVARIALPFMEELLKQTRETVHLNIRDHHERVCIDSLESVQELKVGMAIGHRSPLYAGASSKCLLAFSDPAFVDDYLQQVSLRQLTATTITHTAQLRTEIESIRQKGYAASLAERIPGLGSLSAPVFNHHGKLLAAIGLALPEIRFCDENYRNRCLDYLLLAARRLSSAMGAPDENYPIHKE